MFRARLEFQDGEAVDLPVEHGQTIIEAAMMADAPVRYDCSSGTCGTCIGRLTTGSVERARCDPPIVTQSELEAGVYPTCLTRLLSNSTFRFDYPLLPQPSAAARRAAVVTEVAQLADTVVRLRLELPCPEDFRFQSGQYLRIRPPGIKVARAYSLASIPDDLPMVELLIRLIPGGEVSTWLRDKAAVGDRIAVFGPLGSFALDTTAAKQVFIAGGTGLSPMLSMIRQARAVPLPRLLCFGCTRHEDLFLLDDLAEMAAAIPGLEVRVAAMECKGGGVREGTAVSLLDGNDLQAGASFHLCGPPAMVDAARNFLTAHQVPTDSIRAERFQPGG